MSAADGQVNKSEVFPLDELFTKGVLWAINRTMFHPRGFALALDHDHDGNVTGWQLWGDGDEPWQYDPALDENERFTAFEALLASVRR